MALWLVFKQWNVSEVMCTKFLGHEYLILFLHLWANGEISKDLEEIEAEQ